MIYDTFTFDRFEWDEQAHCARFFYSYAPELTFVETLQFSPSFSAATLKPALLNTLLFNLHIALGISYWKAHAPKNIIIHSGTLSQKQAEFWNTVYTKGLGEFFYTNNIDFRRLVQFPFDAAQKDTTIPLTTPQRALVPLGGGKDSLTTISLLQEKNIQFDTYSLNTYDIISQQVETLGTTHLSVQRIIDEKLFSVADAYNGHVPISMIYAFTSLFVAAAGGYSEIILSNERSANYGNVGYFGEIINHQWSKSIEFENLFRAYVAESITPSINYFSLLRPYFEIRIAQLFAQYHAQNTIPFTSCNRNFAIRTTATTLWCGECPKCAFVFTIFSPFFPKEKLVALFGKNLFASEALIPLFLELLGLQETKPFDCVGTPEEVIVAFFLANESGAYTGDAVMTYVTEIILQNFTNIEKIRQMVFSTSHEHNIPPQFQ